jgi:hypothetical protein
MLFLIATDFFCISETYLRLSGHRSQFPQLLLLRAPSVPFYETLLKAIHIYNSETASLTPKQQQQQQRPVYVIDEDPSQFSRSIFAPVP